MAEIRPAIIEPTAENVRAWLIGRVAHYLDESAGAIDPGVPLPEYGLDSVYAFTLCGEIEDTLSVIVEPALIWDVETIEDLADHIAKLAARRSGGDR
jgi:acyl carrier protein